MSMAIDKLAPADLDKFIHMQSLVERQEADAIKVRALREYYAGVHPVLLTQRQQEFLGSLVHADTFPFAHNLVRSVIDTLSERLSVQGMTVNGADMGDEEGEQAALLWAWWKANRCDLMEQDAYAHALTDGRTYVMVSFDAEAGQPRIVEHRVDDGTNGITFYRDPEDPSRVLFATRYFWTYDPTRPGSTGIERKTVYLPGEIRKYKRSAGGLGAWAQVVDDGDPSWPLPWRDAQGRPLGVAVVEFANPGGSEIEQIIGLQNALNKSWLDLIAAADASGFPIMSVEYADGTGLGPAESDDDIEGSDELRIAPGRAVELSGATMKRIDAANLTPMLDVIWALTAAIAGVSRTPQYYLRPVGGADVPSGEALKQLESGLVARAVKRQRIFGQAWEDVLQLALRVGQAFGPYPMMERPSLEIQWADPETRNDTAQAQTAQIQKALGVPDEQVWATLGFTPEQIAAFKASASVDKAAQIASIAAAMRTQTMGSAVTLAQNGGTQNGRANNPVQPGR